MWRTIRWRCMDRVLPVRGEIYVTTRFPSGSIGFASAGDPPHPQFACNATPRSC